MANTYDSKSVNGTGLSYFYNKIKALFVDKASIVDNLTTDDSTKVLSAKQGKVLSDTIDGITGGSGSVKQAENALKLNGKESSAYMLVADYDSNGDKKVSTAENAEKLGGTAASSYGLANGTNIKPAVTTASTRANLATNDTLVTIVGKLAKWFTDLKSVAWSGNYSDLSGTPTCVEFDPETGVISGEYEFENELKANGLSVEGDVSIDGGVTIGGENDLTINGGTIQLTGEDTGTTSLSQTGITTPRVTVSGNVSVANGNVTTKNATADQHAVAFKQMKDHVTNTLKSYSTTTSMNSAISTALTPYATTSSVNTTLADYAKKTDLTNVYKYKGSKNSYADLPTSGNTAGDVWNVLADGINYAWTGSAWDDLGGLSEIDYITTAEIDQIMGITT